jgi:hypothetical protein
MTALTHAQCIDAFEHITRNVMWQEDEDPLLKALAHAGIDDINGLLILDAQQIDELMYDNSGTMTPLEPGHKNLITIFLAYVFHRILSDNPIGDDYLSVTHDGFEAYHVTEYLKLMDPAPATLMPTVNVAHDPVAAFLAAIHISLQQMRTLQSSNEDITDNALLNDNKKTPDVITPADDTRADIEDDIEDDTITTANPVTINVDPPDAPPEPPATVLQGSTTTASRKSSRTTRKQKKKSMTKTLSPPGQLKEPPPPAVPPDVRW